MAPPGLMESRRGTPVGPPSKSIGQIERELDTARGRREFFSNRPDVSDDRALRRMKQADELQRFKNLYTKPVTGSSNLLQMKQGAPRSLAEESMRLANQYGPTFREIGSDIGYGLGSIGRGLGDFIGRGGVIGSILSDLYGRVKGGAQQGIETVGGLYDNLRSAFSGQPTVTYGGSSSISTTSGGQPRVDLTPTSITTEALSPMDLNRNIGDESDPSIFGIENPLFNQQVYDPIRVSDMDMTGVTAQEGNRPVLPENVVPRTPSVYPLPRNVVPMTPVLPQEVTDPRMYQGQTLYAENLGLPSLKQSYDFLRNPEVETPLGNLRFDNVFSGNPQLGYGNTIMINGVPVDLSATIGQDQISGGLSFAFKKGGSVDKYAGLGYKLK